MEPDASAEIPGEPAAAPRVQPAEPAVGASGASTSRERGREEPPSLRAQFAATVEAIKRLVRAHVALARTEAGEIVGEVRRMVALAGVALGAFIALLLLVAIGLPLFLGEWLFGSIGWGVLLGTLFMFDLAVVALLLALDVKAAAIVRALLVAIVIGVVIGAVLGLDLTHRTWTTIGDSVLPNLDPGPRPLIVAVITVAVIGGLLGFIGGLRAGSGGAVGGAIGGAILGAILGVLSAATIPGTVGAALGVLAALLAWPAMSGRSVIRTGIDGDAIKGRFMPDETIQMTKETIEWVRARTPLAPRS